MKQFFIFYFICAILILTTTANAEDCSAVRSYDPRACLFSGSLKGISGSAYANLCYDANLSPLTATPYGSNSGVCSDKVRQDGNACIKFYAKMMCSSSCIACNQFICKDFCSNATSICPSAAEAGCFGTLAYCSDSNTGCTNWNVDISMIPTAPTTTTTKTNPTTTTKAGVTTTTKSTSTTSHTTSSSLTSAANYYNVPLFLQLIFVALFGLSEFLF